MTDDRGECVDGKSELLKPLVTSGVASKCAYRPESTVIRSGGTEILGRFENPAADGRVRERANIIVILGLARSHLPPVYEVLSHSGTEHLAQPDGIIRKSVKPETQMVRVESLSTTCMKRIR